MINKPSFFIFFMCFFLIACAHSAKPPQKEDHLFKEYKHYVKSLNKNNNYSPNQLENIFSFFTLRKQKDMLNTQPKTNQLLKELTSEYLSFPFWMAKTKNHLEKNNKNGTCLLINGFTEKNEPIVFNISYKKTTSWKIDEVQVEYLAPFNKFLTEAVCDRKQRDDIRFKEMMAQ